MPGGEIAYVDTSFLVALAFKESGWQALQRRLRGLRRVFSSTLLEAEFLAVARREGMLERAPAFLRPVSWILPDRRLGPEITRVLEHGYLRGGDLHHLATALFLFPRPQGLPFLTLDQAQATLAAALGFAGIP